ncbi:hypothetical protein HFP05_05235 [Rhodanobacter denitrificans]|nr:hypothetical protein [Rhodanobacter denitrificans]
MPHLLALLRGAGRALALFLGLRGRLLGLDPRCQTEAEHTSDDAHPVKQKTAGPGSRRDQSPLSLSIQGTSRAPSVLVAWQAPVAGIQLITSAKTDL